MLPITRSVPSARLARCFATSARAAEGYASSSGWNNNSGWNNKRTYNQSQRYDSRDARSDKEKNRLKGISYALQRQKRREAPPTHMLTLADYSPEEIEALVLDALAQKLVAKTAGPPSIHQGLSGRSVALMFSKRSTRTRVASETAIGLLGGTPLFLGSGDIQLGVNESLRDTATVVGSMVDGIMARVKGHDEVETLAKYSPVPVVNALSDLYHPTQILADLLTILETHSNCAEQFAQADIIGHNSTPTSVTVRNWVSKNVNLADAVRGKKFAYVGDTNNMTNEFIVALPRLGMQVAIASPKGYDQIDPIVWARVTEAGTQDLIQLTNTPAEAIKDADYIVTDTWISMGQEDEKVARLAAFEGYQLTNNMIENASPKPDWKFMHCLPRHQEEVDDEVFYGPRSIVFPEAENRKWTILAVFRALMANWQRPTFHGPDSK